MKYNYRLTSGDISVSNIIIKEADIMKRKNCTGKSDILP